MRRRLSILLTLLLTVFAVSAMTVSPAYAGVPATGNFLIGCDIDQEVAVDPIVKFGIMPGAPNASHMHDFGGATSVTAWTQLQDLLYGHPADRTTCKLPGDTSAYWVPAAIGGDGSPIMPDSIHAYYRGLGRDSDLIYAFPLGLKHVQGSPTNTNGNATVGGFRCQTVNMTTNKVPTSCPAGVGIEASVYFPACWDGKNLDGNPSVDANGQIVYDHHSLVACPRNSDGTYPGYPGAPAFEGPADSYPVHVPQLQILVEYPPSFVGGHLMTDEMVGAQPGYTMHADFFNGWDPLTMDLIIKRCIDTGISCRPDTNGNIFDTNDNSKRIVITAAELRGE